MRQKHLLALLAGSTLMLGAAAAQEDGYAYGDFDANGDGQVDITEFNDTYGTDLYDTFNADGNDYIDQNEFSSGVYDTFDTDNDGVLTDSEYTTGIDALYGGDYGLAYSDFDADGNGEVTEEEFLNTYDPSGLYSTFDADGNGQLDQAEFNEGLFGIVDDNDDDLFTEDEFNDTPILFGQDSPASGSQAGGGVTTGGNVFNPDEYGVFGDVGFGEYGPLGPGVTGGAMSLSFTSPNEQNVDFNVTGPDGYREDFEVGYFGLETGGDARVVRGLAPGVYSVAATDDNLQLVETKVQVRQGEVIPLNFNMQLIENFNYDLADYEPYGVYEVGAYEPIGVDTYGELNVIVRLGDQDTVAEVIPNVNVTGPDDFRREFEGDGIVLGSLLQGPYSVAATAEGYSVTEGKVDIRNGQAAQVTLTLQPLGASSDAGSNTGGTMTGGSGGN